MIRKEAEALGTRRSVIREICARAEEARREGKREVFDFSLGNPSVPAPPAVNAGIAELLASTPSVSLHGYTPSSGDREVRKALAASLSEKHGCQIDGDDLYMTAGAAAALSATLHALTVPGEEVIVFAPFFPEYRVFCEAAGAVLRVLPTDETFLPSPETLSGAVTEKTAAVLLNSPNNPSGRIVPPARLAALAAALKEAEIRVGHPIYLVSDEPYRELVYDGQTVPFVPAYYDDTVVCYSYSKSLSLPGERIGYALVSPTAADRVRLRRAIAGAGRALGYVCAPSLFQKLLPLVKNETAALTVYAENRKILKDALSSIGYEVVSPDGAFYLFVKAPGGDAAAFCRAAEEEGLYLVPGDDFGAPAYFRIAYCVMPETVRASLPAFRRAAKRANHR